MLLAKYRSICYVKVTKIGSYPDETYTVKYYMIRYLYFLQYDYSFDP